MNAKPTDLPIEPVLPEICTALRSEKKLILAAPPGAGKTSRVPLALAGLIDGFQSAEGKILVLQPRRIAARLAAQRLAQSLGEPVGQKIGISTRIDRKVSAQSKIEVLTDGVFIRRLLSNQDLDGVDTVLFDEIHERSLNMDLGLALAREVQSVLRDDLAIGLMSATLDTERFSRGFGGPVIETQGRQFPIETNYLGRTQDRPEAQMAKAIKRACRETEGSILAFLPGAAEIRRTAEMLDGEIDAEIAPLFGALSPAEQDRAIQPAARGGRKIVLATDIAESSLTIEGISVVVDLGLARRPKQNASGFGTTLLTERASKANVDQRRGRAGRLGPGICYRLWAEAETRGLTASPTPEIESAGLSGLRLTLAAWGERDAERLPWLDPPPAGRMVAAEAALQKLGALTDAGDLTEQGRQMVDLPLAPDLAALIACAPKGPEKALSAELAVLIGEAGLGGNSLDLMERLPRFRSETSARAKILRDQAKRWAGKATPDGNAARILARAWPDRIARRRDDGKTWLLASGSAARVPQDSPLAKSEWLVVASLSGNATSSRITQAVAISETEVRALFPPIVEEIATFDAKTNAFRARRVERLGAIVLSETPLPRPSGHAAKRAWLDYVRTNGFEAVGLADAIAVHLARIGCLNSAGFDSLESKSHANLEETVETWLAPSISERAFRPPDAKLVQSALVQSLNWPEQNLLNQHAPLTLSLPTGRRVSINWLDDRAPLIEARVQEFYGTSNHPFIAEGRIPVTLQFLSPGGKPVATTRDLEGFWTGGYADMAKDMRSRYPKHDWPIDPANAKPHAGLTKARLNKS